VQADEGAHFTVEMALVVLHVEVDLEAADEAAAVVVVDLLDAEGVLALVDGEQVD